MNQVTTTISKASQESVTTPNSVNLPVRLRAFRAVDEPTACADFLAGHHQALKAYGVSGTTSSNETWTENPHAFVVMGEDVDIGTLLCGIRLHLAHDDFALPTDDAVGRLDPRLRGKIRADRRYSVGEICGMWRTPHASNVSGLVPEMAISAIAMTRTLGVQRVWGLAPNHTLSFWERLGYRVDTSVGQDGAFAYPDPRYVSRVVHLDLDRFDRIPLAAQHRINDLQRRPIQQRRIEIPGFTAHVDIDLSLTQHRDSSR